MLLVLITSPNLYIYPENPVFLCKTRIGHLGLRNTDETSERLRKPGHSLGLVPGGLRGPGTQSVCLQDRGSKRPEKWLNRFLVRDCVGPPGASSGFLRPI